MMNQHPNDDSSPPVPKALEDALAGLGGLPPAVPPEVDRAILAEARRRLQVNRRWRRAWWLGGAAAAVAAMVMVAVRVLETPLTPANLPLSARMHAMNESQRVTILDAYRLAKMLDSGQKPGPEWDVNGDGIVDRKDVDAIAQAAVKLGRGAVQ